MDEKYLGSRILSELNDLKRTLKSASEELNINLSILKAAVNGDLPKNELDDLINKICSFYPINKDEFTFEEIKISDRFVHFKAKDAFLTSRKYQRINSAQQRTDYYEYRDSATSRLSSFRPEWIKEIRVVENNDPLNKEVAYNNGHFMHQLTFFVGPVNFYYQYKGEYTCETMNTGDSNYIPPFIPHSFTSRNKDQEAYIVAVTFGGNFKKILPRVSALDNKMMDYIKNLIDARGNNSRAKKQTYNLKNIIPENKVKSLSRDLSFCNSGVLIKKVDDYQFIKKGLFKAASSENFFSGARGFHIKSESQDSLLLTNPCDSFLFNYGNQSVILEHITLNKKVNVNQGDSLFIACGDEFKIVVKSSCSLFMVTLDLYLTPSIIDEIISFSDDTRIYEETKQWFNG
ncbi:MAG: hypothetical protein VX172_02120 [Pseudomonadota bacterium]|nr:hypothetical protein [Pseudomonadota bacterium]